MSMKHVGLAVLLGATISCAGSQQAIKPKLEMQPVQMTIQTSWYKDDLKDLDGDGQFDYMERERLFPASYGSNEPKVKYFMARGKGYLSRSPDPEHPLTVVEPNFFDRYNACL